MSPTPRTTTPRPSSRPSNPTRSASRRASASWSSGQPSEELASTRTTCAPSPTRPSPTLVPRRPQEALPRRRREHHRPRDPPVVSEKDAEEKNRDRWWIAPDYLYDSRGKQLNTMSGDAADASAEPAPAGPRDHPRRGRRKVLPPLRTSAAAMPGPRSATSSTASSATRRNSRKTSRSSPATSTTSTSATGSSRPASASAPRNGATNPPRPRS